MKAYKYEDTFYIKRNDGTFIQFKPDGEIKTAIISEKAQEELIQNSKPLSSGELQELSGIVYSGLRQFDQPPEVREELKDLSKELDDNAKKYQYYLDEMQKEKEEPEKGISAFESDIRKDVKKKDLEHEKEGMVLVLGYDPDTGRTFAEYMPRSSVSMSLAVQKIDEKTDLGEKGKTERTADRLGKNTLDEEEVDTLRDNGFVVNEKDNGDGMTEEEENFTLRGLKNFQRDPPEFSTHNYSKEEIEQALEETEPTRDIRYE